MLPADLPSFYRRRATDLDAYAPAAAEAFREAARHAEAAVTEAALEPIDLATAATESGYTIEHLRRLLGLEPGYVRKIPNAGTPERPLILRCNLPRKPGHAVRRAEPHAEVEPVTVANTRPQLAPSRTQVAHAIANGD